MHKELLIIDPHIRREAWVESYVSLKVFTEFLHKRIDTEKGIKTEYYKFVLEKIMAYPELQENVPVQEVHRYSELFELICTLLFPVLENENQSLWALGNALTPEVFFSSNAFYNLLTPTSEVYVGTAFITPEESSRLQKELMYQLILQQLYHYDITYNKEWVHGFVNPATGLYQYYRINIGKQFTELKARHDLPPINKADIKSSLSCAGGYQQLEDMLPLENFVATGFSVLTLTEITVKHAVEQLGKVILHMDKNKDKEKGTEKFEHIGLLLKTILGNRHYDFGIMPIFTINNRTGLLYENYPYSIIVKTCVEQHVPKEDFDAFIRDFLKDPATYIYCASQKNALPATIAAALRKAGVEYYSFEPVYHQDRLVGIFEISTNSKQLVKEDHLRANMMPVIPFISQFLQIINDKVNIAIDVIIRDKFTTLQNSVQWKFNEVAWHHFRNNMIEHKGLPLEPVSFSSVFPLYGAIDIRDSTIERNKALRKDLLVQLNLLRAIFQAIDTNFDTADKQFKVTCDHWLYQLSDFISIEQELLLNDFLRLDVDRYLDIYTYKESGGVAALIRHYKNAIGEGGIAFRERRKLESSIQLINHTIGQYFDAFKEKLQEDYPCYFEKQRTDGVEYDIYIGQSIAPKIPFKPAHLENARRMQVKSMAELTRLTQELVPQMAHPLQTTQLLFVYSRAIDISFRTDEHRFDVEGAYNIRYHIIKKRIDKVRLFGSNERLTQVGKIALVYYNERDAAEYTTYIKQLQREGILCDDLEQLELEELQGVSGLKALRVGVQFKA